MNHKARLGWLTPVAVLAICLTGCGTESSSSTDVEAPTLEECGVGAFLSYPPDDVGYKSPQEGFEDLSSDAAENAENPPEAKQLLSADAAAEDSTDREALANALEALAENPERINGTTFEAADDEGDLVARAQLTTLANGNVQVGSLVYLIPDCGATPIGLPSSPAP